MAGAFGSESPALHPQRALDRIAAAMRDTLAAARGDERIGKTPLASVAEAWPPGLLHEAGQV